MICLAMLLEAESRTFFFFLIFLINPCFKTRRKIIDKFHVPLLLSPHTHASLWYIISSRCIYHCHDVTRKNLDQHYQNQLYISNRTQLNIDETDLLYKRNPQNQWQCAFWEFFLWWKKKKNLTTLTVCTWPVSFTL